MTSARRGLAATVTALILGLTVLLALAKGPSAGGPVPFVESLSAAVSGAMLAIGARLPRGYAFVAGMITVVNPCGFALLPAYLGLYLNAESSSSDARRRPVGRSLVVSATVAVSFVLLFGIFGLVITLGSVAISPVLPWIGTGVGIALIVAGGFLAAGRSVAAPLPQRAANRVGRMRGGDGIRSYAVFGAAYGLASLGCSLPIFLSVVATSLQAGDLWNGVLRFVLFGLGMGSILAVLTIATASLGGDSLRRLRLLGAHFGMVSAVLLWLAGSYVVYYWLTIGRLL